MPISQVLISIVSKLSKSIAEINKKLSCHKHFTQLFRKGLLITEMTKG